MSLKPKSQNKTNIIWATAAISTLFASLIGVILLSRWRRKRTEKDTDSEKQKHKFSLVDFEITGLSETEAKALQLEGQDNAIQFKPQRSRKEAIIQNTFSIFNLSLLGIALVQLFLGKPLDALLSLGVVIFNIALNTFQEFFARKRIEQVELATRLKATVVRDGKTRSIDPSEIVLGDIVLIGPGDQLPVDGILVGDGEILVDDSVLNFSDKQGMKIKGDHIYAGSICLTGQAAYRTTQVGPDRKIVDVLSEVEVTKQDLTPIQRIIDRVLRGLLIIVAVLMLMLLSANYRLDLGIPVDTIIDASSVIFSIAPAGLFFMILLTYAAGTADLAKIGALVRQARSVESLAQVNVMCFAKSGVLTGTDVEIEPFRNSDKRGNSEIIAESRIRQILGDYARSTDVPSPATRALFKSFEGNPRPTTEEAPYLSLYGWSGIVFDESDLRGVYILGEPDVLQPFLAENLEPMDGEKEKKTTGVKLQNTLGRLRGIFKRSQSDSDLNDSPEIINGEDDTVTSPAANIEITTGKSKDQHIESEVVESDNSNEMEDPRKSIFRRFLGNVNRIMQRETERVETERGEQDHEEQSVELIFAYYPEVLPIKDDFGTPHLSDGLIPLCRLRFSEKVRPEIVETINRFTHNEVTIKILSSEPAERIVNLLKQVGFNKPENIMHGEISGKDLARLTQAQIVHAARENTIFGEISPLQAAQVVGALRADDQFVAVLGDGVNDVPALRQADLALAMQTSSQAAMSQADIILLEDSPTALQRVLDKGQRIVKGLLDILKIYLAQVTYLALLILAIRFISVGFPYTAAQGTAIATFTLTIPSVGLTLWAASGVMNSASLSRILSRFVIPAAITISTAGMVAYRYYLERTGDMHYAQLIVTYTLVSIGLFLVIFIKPPGRLWAGGASLIGDWRPTILVIILQIAFLIAAHIPLAQEYLKIEPLKDPFDYLIVGLIVICWAITLLIAYWFWPLIKISDRI